MATISTLTQTKNINLNYLLTFYLLFLSRIFVDKLIIIKYDLEVPF